MFRFAHPDFLYLLFLLPVLVAFYVYAIVLKKKAIKKYGNPELLAELMPEVSPKRQHLKFWLLFGAITMVIIVMAGPAVRLQTGDSEASGSGDHGLSGRIQFDVGRRCLAGSPVQGQADVV